MEDRTLKLPNVEGGVRRIGDLFDCVESRHPLQRNIFITSTLEDQKFLEACPIQNMTYELSGARDAESRAEIFGISAEIKLEIGKTIEVEGSASFKKEKRKGYNEEEFMCVYNLQTYIVRTRQSVSDPNAGLIHEQTRREILEGTLSATHYVSSIALGANAIASLRISDSLSHDLLDLSGSLGGKFPVGPINFGIKASIGFLEKESSEFINKSISVTAIPGFGGEGNLNPGTTEEMFDAIEGLPAEIQNRAGYLNLVFQNPELKGVPILYTLSPISSLFDLSSRSIRSYIPFDEEMLGQLHNMRMTLLDFDLDHAFRNLVREENPMLMHIFLGSENETPNPWVAEVDKFQEDKQKEGRVLSQSSDEVLLQYKKGLIGIEGVKDELQKFQENFNYSYILSQAQSFANSGLEILSSIKALKAMDSGLSQLFIFSPSLLKELKDNNFGLKLILQSNPSFEKFPSDPIFDEIYKNGLLLKNNLGLDVRVASANISDDFSLLLKLEYDINLYKETKVFQALKALSTLALAKGREYDATTIYLGAYVSMEMGIGLGSISPSQYGEFVNYAITNIQRLEFPGSALDFLEIAKNSEGFTLLPGTNYIKVANDSINVSKEISRLMLELKMDHNILPMTLEIGDNSEDAPILIILKEGEVAAVCFNKLDIKILEYHLKKYQEIPEVLNPHEMLKYPFESRSIPLTARILSTITGNKKSSKTNVSNPFEAQIPKDANNLLGTIHTFLFTLCFSPIHKFVNNISKHFKWEEILDGKLYPFMRDVGWSPLHGFPENCDFPELLQDFEDNIFEADTIDHPDNEIYQQILLLLEYVSAEQPNTQLIYQVLRFLLEKFWELLDAENSEFHKELKTIINELVLSYADNANFTTFFIKVSRLLALVGYNGNYFKIWKMLDSAQFSLKSSLSLLSMIETVEGEEFSKDERNYFFRNPKINYWLQEFYREREDIGGQMFQIVIGNGKNVPDYIPVWLRQSFMGMLNWGNVLQIGYETIPWTDAEQVLKALDHLCHQQIVPRKFTENLAQELEKGGEVYELFSRGNSLFFWDEGKKAFDYKWSLKEIQDAVSNIRLPHPRNFEERREMMDLEIERQTTFEIRDCNSLQVLQNGIILPKDLEEIDVIRCWRSLNLYFSQSLLQIEGQNQNGVTKQDENEIETLEENWMNPIKRYLETLNCLKPLTIEYRKLPLKEEESEVKASSSPEILKQRSILMSKLFSKLDPMSRQIFTYHLALNGQSICTDSPNIALDCLETLYQVMKSCKIIALVNMGTQHENIQKFVNESLFKRKVLSELQSDEIIEIVVLPEDKALKHNCTTILISLANCRMSNEFFTKHKSILDICSLSLIFWDDTEQFNEDQELFTPNFDIKSMHFMLTSDLKLKQINSTNPKTFDKGFESAQIIKIIAEAKVKSVSLLKPDKNVEDFLSIIQTNSVPVLRQCLLLQDTFSNDNDAMLEIVNSTTWSNIIKSFVKLLETCDAKNYARITLILGQLSESNHIQYLSELLEKNCGVIEQLGILKSKIVGQNLTLQNLIQELLEYFAIYPKNPSKDGGFQILSSLLFSGTLSIPIPRRGATEFLEALSVNRENLFVLSIADFTADMSSSNILLAEIFGRFGPNFSTQKHLGRFGDGETLDVINLHEDSSGVFCNKVLLFRSNIPNYKSEAVKQLSKVMDCGDLTFALIDKFSTSFAIEVLGMSLVKNSLGSKNGRNTDLILVNAAEGENIELEVLDMVANVYDSLNNHFNLLEMGVQKLFQESMTGIFKRIFSGNNSIGFNPELLRNFILQGVKNCGEDETNFGNFMQRFNSIKIEEKFIYGNISELDQNLQDSASLSKILTFVDNAFESHRENDEIDKVPFLCPDCKEDVADIMAEFDSRSFLDMYDTNKRIKNYCYHLRNLAQEGFDFENKPTNRLSLLVHEIESIYGKEMLKNVLNPKENEDWLEQIELYYRPYVSYKFSGFGYGEEFISKPFWKEATWLELRIEGKANEIIGMADGGHYQPGLIRRFRDSLEALGNEFQDAFELEEVLLSEFYWNLHMFGLQQIYEHFRDFSG